MAWLNEYEYLFSTALHHKLKEKIVGRIFTSIKNDKLQIDIQSYGGIDFRYEIDNFADRILNGWTTDYAVYEVEKAFKKHLNRLYFR
jgi:hypothetical protein